MTLSYFVVAEVSWRHMKDVHREEERMTMGGDPRGGMQMGQTARANSNGGYGAAYGGGGSGYGCGAPSCPYGCGPGGDSEEGYGGGGGMGGGGGYGGGGYGASARSAEDPFASGQTPYAAPNLGYGDQGNPRLVKRVSENI